MLVHLGDQDQEDQVVLEDPMDHLEQVDQEVQEGHQVHLVRLEFLDQLVP